jgi:hypothetical protein
VTSIGRFADCSFLVLMNLGFRCALSEAYAVGRFAGFRLTVAA